MYTSQFALSRLIFCKNRPIIVYYATWAAHAKYTHHKKHTYICVKEKLCSLLANGTFYYGMFLNVLCLKLPVKWLALESIMKGTFTHKT